MPTGDARAQPTVVLTGPTPAIADGRPVVPAYWATSSSSTTAIEGKTHIHAIANPDTYKDASGYVNPPSNPWTARWTVNTLPDPAHYANSFYWLGVPTSQDGSNHYSNPATHLWTPSPESVGGTPAWHSFFPFKPSVTAVNHYLQGGGVVHHPKGVNFNSHFIEHMWLDWGSAHKQPFTWVIAANVSSWPSRGYTHYLLDSGRAPNAVGFPALSDTDVDDPRTINDGLAYRNLLSISHTTLTQTARLSTASTGVVRATTDPTLRPRMYIGIFNGSNSYVGAYSPGKRTLHKGTLNNGANQQHRYYVLGRKNGAISQDRASHLLVFEIRYWNKALTGAQLEAQYAQISSTWHFDKYRGL